MKRVATCFAILSLLLAAQVFAGDTERVTRTFRTGPSADLRLNAFCGHVRITGSDTSEVTIDATRYGSRSQLDAIGLVIDQRGSTVVIEANKRERSWFTWWGHSDVVQTDFEIKVPRRTNLNVHVFSSTVDVNGVDGDQQIHTFSAPVRLDGVGGSLNVHSFSGPITVRTVNDGDIVVDTFSGRVDLRLRENAHAIADFRSFSGRLTSSLPLLVRSTNRRSTTAEIDGPGPAGHIRVKTFSGNLRIDR